MVYTKSFHKEDVEFRKVSVYSLVLTIRSKCLKQITQHMVE